MVSRLSLSLLASAFLVGACSLHAQTAPAAPSWASPVNDATGQQIVATPVTPGTPALHPRLHAQAPALRASSAPRTAAELPAEAVPLRMAEAPHAPASLPEYVIPAGRLISEGLGDYVKRFGYSLRWTAPPDYRLDSPFPIPAGPMKDGVKYVVNAYQAQGGLIGVVPGFADLNKVVVIQLVTADKENH